MGQDRIGLPDAAVDLVLEPFYHANIAVDWEPQRREEAFKWLEENGHGDLVKVNVMFSFRKEQLADARWLQTAVKLIQAAQAECGIETENTIPDPTMKMEVHYGTLTAFVREQVECGAELPLEKLGATVGQIVKIKPRKGNK
jgi:hypothetical protein